MLVVRPVKETDLDQIYKISRFTKAGLTTLPHDKKILGNRIYESLHSFRLQSEKPKGDSYIFVLEDTTTHRVLGVSGINSKVGGFEPFYKYKIKKIRKKSRQLHIENTIHYLQLSREHNGPTEIGSLFLIPQARNKGAGRLLSLSRFLFIAQHRKRFEKEIISEMRGYFDKKGRSPFWEAVGRYFFAVAFKKADLMQMRNKAFIKDLIPEHPIYIPLLSYVAQKAIGKVHKETEPALHFLETEGFRVTDDIDIFEAGPVVSAKANKIRSIRESHQALVVGFVDHIKEDRQYIISNMKSARHFRATMGPLKIFKDRRVKITKKTGEILSVTEKDKVCFVSLKSEAD